MVSTQQNPGAEKVLVQYDMGTLVLQGAPLFSPILGEHTVWDERTRQWRAESWRYRVIIETLRSAGISYEDTARSYDRLDLPLKTSITPRQHQKEALEKWFAAGGRGIVSLPTGAGKTILAVLILARLQRPALILVPTIDLMQQWAKVFATYFNQEVGLLGGGCHEIKPLTIATYDSASIHCEKLGSQFGILIFDECHHLPAPQYLRIALTSLAPFRLGLSATVERADGRDLLLADPVGEVIYEGKIHALQQGVLAPYKVVSIEVPMTEREWAAYQEARGIYLQFIRRYRIDIGGDGGWMEFVRLAARSKEGQKAMTSYRLQKKMAQCASAKTEQVWKVLCRHVADRVIIFTDENSLAYHLGSQFVLPVLTHHTRLKERVKMLDAFRSGDIKVLVTSKVLNEGVDVPEARVGIVVSGSGAVREHVQRLGRILRHQPGKEAILYEIISKGTSEYYVNERRRQHDAYQRTSALPPP